MPPNRTLNPERARWASLSYWHPGSPQQQQAGREFLHLLLIQQVKEVLAKSPPFTSEQREPRVHRCITGFVASANLVAVRAAQQPILFETVWNLA